MFSNKLGKYYNGSIVLACLFAALYFQVAWRYPLIDGFPLVERMLDSQFNPKDFFTNTFSDYSPRLYIATFFLTGSQLFSVDYTEFVAVANIIRIFVTFIALYYLYLGWSKDYKVSLVALYLSAISFLSMPKMVAWWPLTYDITGSSLAACFLMIAWSLVVYRRLFIAYIAIALAILIHPVVGVHGLIIAGLIFYAANGVDGLAGEFKKLSTYVAIALVIGVFLANYIPYANSLDGFKLPSDRFVEINALFKHAHHYLPTHFDWQNWLAFALFSVFFGYMWIKVKDRITVNKTISTMVVYSVLMMILGWVFVELFPIRAAVTFIPYRAFPILIPVFILVTAIFCVERLKNGDYISVVLIHFIFIPFKKIGLTWKLFPDFHSAFLPTLVMLLAFGFILINDKNNKSLETINNWLSFFISRFFYKTVFSVLSVLVVFSIIRFEFNIPSLSTQPGIYSWLNANATNDDVIVAELNAANNQKIRLLSKRAVVVSKDFPFLEKYYEEWYERYVDVYIDQKKARGNVDNKSADELNKLLDKYGATILLRTKALENASHFSLLGTVGGEKATVLVYKNKSLIR